MCRAVFDETVRPFVSEFPIGGRGVGFDRQELDDWATAYVEAKAIDKKGATEQQSPRSERQKGDKSWRENRSQASSKGKVSGISTRKNLGHKNGSITSHYSGAELGHLIEVANMVSATDSRGPVLTILKRKQA